MNANEKLINAEKLISRCFIASPQNMFGESYKAIIRNMRPILLMTKKNLNSYFNLP